MIWLYEISDELNNQTEELNSHFLEWSATKVRKFGF